VRISAIGVSLRTASRNVVVVVLDVDLPGDGPQPLRGAGLPAGAADVEAGGEVVADVSDPPRTSAIVVVPDASAVVVGAVSVPDAMEALAKWNRFGVVA
jgi:hypothetical protein